MRHVVADIETDGLLDELTTVHCLVLRDLETDDVLSCANQPGHESIEAGLRALVQAERIYFHNGIKFDYPALRKVYPKFVLTRDQIRDTMVIAQMRYAHIKDQDYKNKRLPGYLKGSHSLEAWGYRLGVHKGEYTEWCKANGIENAWAEWRPEMQTYCEGDTATTKALVLKLRSTRLSAESVEIEHALSWYLAAQERAGVPFDLEKAVALQGRLAARREEIAQLMREEFGPRYKKDGKPFSPKKDIPKRGVVAGAEYQKLKLVEFNPGSRQDIAYHLTTRFGWTPTEFTDSGQPELNEKTLKGLADVPATKLLIEYLMVDKRLGQLAEGKEAWLRHARNDGPEGGKLTGLFHIHGRVKQNAAITHRATHSNPNLAQVPKVGAPFGAECRELFYVPEGWVMVGADAASLEARCLAHYMARYDNGAYGALLLGGDVHTANRIALGLPEGKEHRDKAKTFLYAFLYGAGSAKLGSIVSPELPEAARTKLGNKLRAQFLKGTPALKHLIDAVQAQAKQNGYLKLIDGRRTYVRSEHAALNTLLQSAGSLIVKKWMANYAARLEREYGQPGWTGKWCPLLYIHDENQLACRPEIADDVCRILLEEIRSLTEHFHWRVALDGEAKIGHNWKDTH